MDKGENIKAKNFNKKNEWLDYKTVAIVLIIKLLILSFAFQSYQIVNDQPIKFYEFFNLWRHWDAENYLTIAQFGYTAIGEHRYLIVFFPLFPALTALVNIVIDDNLISAFIISSIASVALGLVFRELVRLDFSEKTAQLAVLFLFIFPTSYFLHIPYTESLFLALLVGSFLAARKRKWIIAGFLGGLACLTRINGLFLFPALIFEAWEDYRETKRFNWEYFSLMLIPLGFSLYLGLNYFVSGNPLMFLIYQQEHWGKYLRFPLYGIWDAYKAIFWKKPSPAMMEGFQELLFVFIGLFAIAAGWRHLRNSYRVWMISNWLVFISTSYVLSIPRYTLILFPIFILMALAARRSWLLMTLFITWSALYLSLFITQFVRGWWAF